MNGKVYGPYVTEIEKRQNTNTWLHMKLFEGKNNEIRRVMRKFSLRVNRLQRVRYGPYTLGEVPNPNDLQEVPVLAPIERIMYKYLKDRVSQANTRVSEQQQQKILAETKKAFRDQKKLKQDSSIQIDDDEPRLEIGSSNYHEEEDLEEERRSRVSGKWQFRRKDDF